MSGFDFFYSTDFDFDSIDGIHLLQDHVGTSYPQPWDDYNYTVTFQVHRVVAGVREPLGRTKILVKDYKNTSDYFLLSTDQVGRSRRITDLLNPQNVVSLASDIDYYRRVGLRLKTEAVEYLRKICDGSYNYDSYKNYSAWGGFESSLFRSSMAKAILKKGHQIALGSYEAQDSFSFSLGGLTDCFDVLNFNFDNGRTLGPTNINLLVGRNGVGKSHILRHLVDTLTGVRQHTESWPFFHKVVVAAYSPFESFKTESELSIALGAEASPPRETSPENELASKDEQERRRRLVNEYVYLGFRDPKGTFSLEWPKESSARAVHRILQYDMENQWSAVGRFNLLFQTLKRSIEFDAIELNASGGESIVLKEKDDALRNELAGRGDLDYARGIRFLNDGEVVSLSSGQTIYSYLLPSLVAEVDGESLLILDEPELYLHPAMEVGLLDMLKQLLIATKSNAIIATHSSILAREVEQSGISILRKVNGRTEVSRPSVETFGQTVEVIMGLAFDDYEIRKPYEDALDIAVKTFSSPEAALEKLGPDVGDEALAYLTAKVEDDEDGADIEIERRAE
ncbi:AAA family ATPase [Pseudomonas alliivorans]|nr:AAA family ATPase [Pseudomonas alliivorans]MEE5161946.1 AAA family ATPase [Pseudomonas alliivorans]